MKPLSKPSEQTQEGDGSTAQLGNEDRRLLGDKTWLRPDEVSRVLRVSKRQVYHLVEKGALKVKREAAPPAHNSRQRARCAGG